MRETTVAASVAAGAVTWVQEALSGLVDEGTITQEQADAVETALEDLRPERGSGHHRFGRQVDRWIVTESLGMAGDDLRAAMDGGRTVADVAADKGIDVRTVVDAIVAGKKRRVEHKVAVGDLTAEQADDMLPGAEDRAIALVNGEAPPSAVARTATSARVCTLLVPTATLATDPGRGTEPATLHRSAHPPQRAGGPGWR